jgi:hypothetical protein
MTTLRVMPMSYDSYDVIRTRRAIFCVFNLSGSPLTLPVRSDAVGAWKLRLSTESEGYGGSGELEYDIPPEPEYVEPDDGPKRLYVPAAASKKNRSVRMPPWSAAVYVREFDEERGE